MTKTEDQDLAIKTIQAFFHTIDDDKDRNDGISESIVLNGNQILGFNLSWGNGLVFRDGHQDSGQSFDIQSNQVKAKEVGNIQYQYEMDTDQKWNVVFRIIITLENNHQYKVAERLANIPEGHYRKGSVALTW
jgi:hypothetical protein